MKKTILLLAGSALFFAGCTNENTENPIPVGEVTINGTIVADLDEDEDTGDLPLETIPAGVTVYALDANTGALMAEPVLTTAGGKYTFVVKIGGPRDIEIVVGDFSTSINVYDAVEADYVNKDAVYNDRESETIFDAVKGATYIQNIEISQPTVIDFE